jgi:RHH-type transcriptional regulator, proline utilization regulon repressor / proline dehydrogenase / delta 1-pyrroline-5-carboxylate dehydrogenase
MYWNKQVNYSDAIQSIIKAYTTNEIEAVDALLNEVGFFREHAQIIRDLAREFSEKTREIEQGKKGMASLVQHYDLSTEEGIVLMCVAEALLRIPDAETEKLLIADKLSSANWEKHLGLGGSSFVNMTTWGLSVSGKILSTPSSTSKFKDIWHKMIKKTSEGFIRQAVKRTIKWMSEEFVLGRTIDEALKRGRVFKKQGYTFSFDMLGEAAMTQRDAQRYFMTYAEAIEKLARHLDPKHDIFQSPGISVKLSALYPRYEFAQQEHAIPALAERLKQLALRAKDLNIALTVDAEEADRLDMSLQIFKLVYADPEFKQWEGLGLAVQAYQKRAVAVCDWVVDLAKQYGRRIQVRLVKGAYWDTEIKLAQMANWHDYPVFTRKETTDVSYLVCAQKLLAAQPEIYPQFATHNAYTVAAILTSIEQNNYSNKLEFQNLQGMGKSLHQQIIARKINCRIYAPVGSYKELLPYLVRRLLENGANTSFVNQIGNSDVSIDELTANPVTQLENFTNQRHDKIVLPSQIFNGRLNSLGINYTDLNMLAMLQAESQSFFGKKYVAAPFNGQLDSDENVVTAYNPSDRLDQVGSVLYSTMADVDHAFAVAEQAYADWSSQDVEQRALICETFADLLELNQLELICLLQREAGKVLADAIDEIREAVDFCRYYAIEARKCCSPHEFFAYTGESNIMTLVGRGVVVCVSPWNFPVAIFVGQIVAALVMGNCVIAKPAEQTSLVAAFVIDLLYQSGLSKSVLSLLPGLGEDVGAALVAHTQTAAIMFTGSTEVAKLIQSTCAQKDGPITPIIAETGGINTLIADSSALLEQLTADVIKSAFGSAGQRCSALRVLIVQEDIADAAIEMIAGAMALLHVDDSKYLSTDVGPVIDEQAKQALDAHIGALKHTAKLIYATELKTGLNGSFVAPHLFEIDDLDSLRAEIFGPVLQVYRFKRKNLSKVIQSINDWRYGLTFGVHSRIDSFVKEVTQKIQVGNVYVNRNTIGAVVGLQPFGGCRLSGTGPKAGGPHYLPRLAYEKVISTDTTAAGGNASLMALESDEG